MVDKIDNIFSLSSHGLKDWLVQRVTAVLIAIYTLLILGFILFHRELQFDVWQAFFSHAMVKIFSFLVVVSTLLHAWQGIWTVLTDYVKSTALRLILQLLILILFFCCLIWSAEILWGT